MSSEMETLVLRRWSDFLAMDQRFWVSPLEPSLGGGGVLRKASMSAGEGWVMSSLYDDLFAMHTA